jgi:L-ascorbate metabolism protein UlaG (beta-lactamase superfamily)
MQIHLNYFRNKKNIIGSMSNREAFQFAEDIGVKLFIPTHWDIFEKKSSIQGRDSAAL